MILQQINPTLPIFSDQKSYSSSKKIVITYYPCHLDKNMELIMRLSLLKLSTINYQLGIAIKLIVNRMVERYEQIFKELYEARLINKHTPQNSYDRVRLIQKKMSENIPKKHSRVNLSFHISDSSPFLEDVESATPKRIVRHTFGNSKILKGRRMSLPSQRQSFDQFQSTAQKPISISQYLKNNNSLTQRQKKPFNLNPTGLYHSKKFQMYKFLKRSIKRQAALTAQTNKRIPLTRRTTTPSKNVLIGGCNLEEQAEEYRKNFKKIEIQVQLYKNQLKMKESEQKSATSRLKMSRNGGQNNINRKEGWLQKQTKQIIKKLEHSRGKQKDQNIDLMPWTVLVPEYQYY